MVKSKRENSEKAQAMVLEGLAAIFIIFLALGLIYNAPYMSNPPDSEFLAESKYELNSLMSEKSDRGYFKQKFLEWNRSNKPSGEEIDIIEKRYENYLYQVKYYCDNKEIDYIKKANLKSPTFVYKSSFPLQDYNKYDGKRLDNQNFVCSNLDSNSHYYNQVKVEVIVWSI